MVPPVARKRTWGLDDTSQGSFSTPYIGDKLGSSPANDGNPYNRYVNPYWVDEFIFYYMGNNGNLDPGTFEEGLKFIGFYLYRPLPPLVMEGSCSSRVFMA